MDLIEARPPAGLGILALLDEECRMPRGSDATWAAKLAQQHSGHPRFAAAAAAAPAPSSGGRGAQAPLAGAPGFTVQHYAGPVAYTAATFLDKNRDTISQGV